MSNLNASVIVATYKRPDALRRCLLALAGQSRPPQEVVVVWQGEDKESAESAEAATRERGWDLKVVHCPQVGIVPAENTGLRASSGKVILLIDDDAVAPPNWVDRHISFYSDPTVGAVGGPYDNLRPGEQLKRRAAVPTGRLTWYGRSLGNLFDQPEEWRSNPPQTVDHLAGNNMSLRRCAFDVFDENLRPYWQMFEAEACLQAKGRGYRVVFDFANVVQHYPTNTAFVQDRAGDLRLKVDNPSYNHAYILAKHSPPMLRFCRLVYLVAVGSVANPGLIAFPVALRRHGHFSHEFRILLRSLRYHLEGWSAGARARGG